MSMSMGFLLVVFVALLGLAVVIAIMVMLFRVASRSSARRPGDDGNAFVPPIIGDDSLTNPANPLYHLHHPTSTPDDSTRRHASDPSPSHSSSDSSPSSSSSFDSGSSSSSSFDSGSSSSASDSGSNCG
ncbi:MAG: hypothetical protein ACKODH_01770 [Limisphaerales bacterium]